jgi:hypothetical protein
MLPAIYISIDGRPVSYDLDRVSDIAQSYIGKRAGWTCTLIHIHDTDAFVELRSSPQDIRGNSAQEEQEEVDAEYIGKTYGLGLMTWLRFAPPHPCGLSWTDASDRDVGV